jgi:hypothetical protein
VVKTADVPDLGSHVQLQSLAFGREVGVILEPEAELRQHISGSLIGSGRNCQKVRNSKHPPRMLHDRMGSPVDFN